MAIEIIPVVLSGGAGKRLWPLSREKYPKQFLSFFKGRKSMFQETLLRLPKNTKPAVIVCNHAHRFIVAKQLQDISAATSSIILEPFGKNTAPAVAIAALQLIKNGSGGDVMLVLPSDHLIADTEKYHSTIELGKERALEGKIISFGIVPDSPQTGFGYIKASSKDPAGADIVEFKEKPDSETAKKYVSSGEYYWNSGMFMFTANQYISELKLHAPDIWEACEKAYNNIKHETDFDRLEESSFDICRSESIDYAVMEKTNHSMVIPLDAGWDDLGSWGAIAKVSDNGSQEGNFYLGEVFMHDCANTYINGHKRLVTAVGLKDIVIVDTPDALLVAHKDESQKVKNIVESLNESDRKETNFHRLVHRPWGTFDGMGRGDNYQVKCITVRPGHKLSVQKHFRRAEHWTVVKGTATVTLNDETLVLEENQSVYIPVEAVHALENTGTQTLELIEVQCGDYLGEDDIVRLEDRYGREGTNE